MAKRRMRAGSLIDSEIGIIQNLLARGTYNSQDILGLVNSVRRSEGRGEANNGRISEVKRNKRQYKNIEPATDAETDAFIQKAENPGANADMGLNPLAEKRLKNLFPLNKSDQTKFAITETDRIECKASFGTKHINDKFRTIAAFANNKGGYIAFGIEDKTWALKGIDGARFKALDRKELNQALLATFSCAIDFEMGTLDIGGRTIGFLYIAPARIKPVITISNKNGANIGHIYYRYQAESRMIGPSELQQIIEKRAGELSQNVLNKHIATILANGIENSAVLNVSTGQVDGKAGSFLIDEEVLPNISFIKEGEFNEKSGKPTLKLIGEITETASVIKTIKENLTDRYRYTWKQLADEVKKRVPEVTSLIIHKVIREHEIKSRTEFSAYSFRSHQQAEEYKISGKVPSSISSIYNEAAIDFVVEKASEIVQASTK